MKDDKLYIIHISECIQRIETYTQDGKDVFMQTQMVQDAVIRNFEILGEATKRISAEFRLIYPDVPWRNMAGFRDVLIHNYISVDLDVIWEIIQADLPDLSNKIKAILQELTEAS